MTVGGMRLENERLVIGATLVDGKTIETLAPALSCYRWADHRAEATWQAIVKLGPGADINAVRSHLSRNGNPGLPESLLSSSLDEALRSANTEERRRKIVRDLLEAHTWERIATQAQRVVKGEDPVADLGEIRRLLDAAPAQHSLTLPEPVDLARLLREGLPPRDWLIEDWLQGSDVALLAGHPACGKTTVVFDLALALALGRPWAGLIRVPFKRRVLIIDEEMGPEELVRYFAELGADPDHIEPIKIYSSAGLEVYSDAGLALIKKLIQLHAADLVVMDSSQHVLGYDNENDSATITAGFKRLFTLRQFGVAVILIHHLRKPAFGEKPDLHSVRGSSAFTTQPSTVWLASRGPDGMDLRQVKRRSGPKRQVRIRKDVDPDGISRLTAETVQEAQAAIDSAREFVLELIQASGGAPMRLQEITDAGRSLHPRRTLQRALRDLMDQGAVTKPRLGFYALSETKGPHELPF